jgi:virginiamycin B lyase
MRSAILRQRLAFGVIGTALFFLASFASAATITGEVKGPDGVPIKGAFVNAQNAKTRITVSVLSDKDGRYHFENLPAGSYSLRIRAVGYRGDPREGVTLTADQKASFDWSLQPGAVRWSDLSFYQGDTLLPAGKAKDLLNRHCFECHEFQSRMASMHRDEEGWTQAVNFMRTAMGYRLTAFTDADAATVIPYLNNVFGLDSKVPSTVDAMPEYKNLIHAPFADEAMKIVYVTYELPGPNRMPFSAFLDKDGIAWIPYFGPANQIGRLDPKTGEVQEFRVPFTGTAGIHSAVPAADGSVWLAEQGSNRLGRWDPKTRQITEFQDDNPSGRPGSKHTVRIDSLGNVWTTGSPLAKFDPKTGKFTHFADVPSSYGVALGSDGTPWFAEFSAEGKIGKVDPETGKVTKYAVPTANAWPRRIQVDDSGMVWFAEYGENPAELTKTGKIARFDPKTETFKEYPLPGQSPSPYAFDRDKTGRLCYSNFHEDVVGCLDPKTGKVVEYPMPFSENTMREFFVDSQGRVWFGTPTNNKVGYFYLASN